APSATVWGSRPPGASAPGRPPRRWSPPVPRDWVCPPRGPSSRAAPAPGTDPGAECRPRAGPSSGPPQRLSQILGQLLEALAGALAQLGHRPPRTSGGNVLDHLQVALELRLRARGADHDAGVVGREQGDAI